MAGHLFIVRGDITKLACDAWLATGDAQGPAPRWIKHLGATVADDHADAHNRSFETSSPSVDEASAEFDDKVVPWRPALNDPTNSPQPWVADVTVDPVRQSITYLQGAWERFGAVGGTAAKHGRSKPVFALPLAGVGGAGFKSRAGEVLANLIPAIHQWLSSKDVDADVALVLWRDSHFHAAQYVRRQHPDPWTEVEPHLQVIRSLAQLAVRGQLVLFLGAGVSQSAGLPSWSNLLSHLARRLNLSYESWEQIEKLDHLDRAQALETLLQDQLNQQDSGASFKRLIASVIQESGGRYSLEHGLLASLPANEAVTTNYDELFEMACTAAARPRYRIPWEPPNEPNHWLLKMHGCVSVPDSIVLSRRDFSRYEAEYGVLGSIVETLLVTRHMLFIGFSMTDPNFRAIFDTVKHAVQRRDEWLRPRGKDSNAENPPSHAPLPNSQPLGTALLIDSNEIFRRLWRGDVEVVELSCVDDTDWRPAARRVEIALDCLAAHCCDEADVPLFDKTLFQSGVIPDSDVQRLKNIALDLEHLQTTIQAIEADQVRSRLRRRIRALLDELGMEPRKNPKRP